MTRRLEPDDLYAIKLVEDPQITPDGDGYAPPLHRRRE